MYIEFNCSCGKRYRVDASKAGKQATCKECGNRMSIPAKRNEPSEIATATVSGGFWYVSSFDGNQYGPIDRKELESWVAENSITPECQIYCDNDGQWFPATHYFPQLRTPYRAVLTRLPNKNTFNEVSLRNEIQNIPGLQMSGGSRYRVGDERTFFENFKANSMFGFYKRSKVVVTETEVFQFHDSLGQFALLTATDHGEFAPSEFVALMKGRLPEAMVLLRNSPDNPLLEIAALRGSAILGLALEQASQAGGVWASTNRQISPLAEAAQQHGALHYGMRWEGTMGGLGSTTRITRIQWGAQAIPVSDDTFLLVGHSVPQLKMKGLMSALSYNVHWFAEFRRQFAGFVEQLSTAKPNAAKAGRFDYFAGGIWLSVCIEVLNWVQTDKV